MTDKLVSLKSFYDTDYIFTIDNYNQGKESFTNTLFTRLRNVFKFYGILEEEFMFLVNIIDRGDYNRTENRVLIYAGLESERSFLENELESKKVDANKLEDAWDGLYQPLGKEDLGSQKLYNDLNDHKFKLVDIEVGELKIYFKKNRKKFNKYEEVILNSYFDIEKDLYIPLPIIQFGNFEGFLFLIFKGSERSQLDQFADKYENIDGHYCKDDAQKNALRNIKQLIRTISVEFESLLLDWDLVGDDIYKDSKIRFQHLIEEGYYKRINRNPILGELGYDTYYRNSTKYFKTRIEQNNLVPKKLQEQNEKLIQEYRKNAIIAILIDSYAHNISAHSLTALNWWFQKRAVLIQDFKIKLLQQEKEKVGVREDVKEILEDKDKFELQALAKKLLVLTDSKGALERLLHDDKKEEENPYVDKLYESLGNPTTWISSEVSSLLKFLLEKGAFWSGITRDSNFGGQISSLFNVLWYGFINNPLYLGTIAYSESIVKIVVKISFVESKAIKYKDYPNFLYRRVVKQEDILATVDLGTFEEHNKEEESKETISHFVHRGDNFDSLKDLLENCQVFFPGGVVGRHAFFTIIENEIRNVKHYKGDALKEMQKNGLELNISIEEVAIKFGNKAKEKPLYKIGIWIGSLSYLMNKKAIRDTDKYLILKKVDGLKGDIITNNQSPKLGGNYQDKICACMLFNNAFGVVQTRSDGTKTERDYKYFPWITASTLKEKDNFEFYVSSESYYVPKLKERLIKRVGKDQVDNWKATNQLEDKLFEEFKDDFRKAYSQHYKAKDKGYFIKYFHLWKGAIIYNYTSSSNLEWDNLSRFRFVNIAQHNKPKEALVQVRREGVIRVINTTLDENEKDINLIYSKWLTKWIKGNAPRQYIFRIENAIYSALIYNNGEVTYLKRSKARELEIADQDQVINLNMIHGGKRENKTSANSIAYRSHGILLNHFFEQTNSRQWNSQKIVNKNRAELYEVLATRIYIFDNRVEQRFNKERKAFYRDYLNCAVYSERTVAKEGQESTHWEDVKDDIVENCNFLVMHLSFMQQLLNTKYKGYGEDMIGEFLEKEIWGIHTDNPKEKEEQIQENLKAIKENFILVVTTGRGRMAWWQNVRDEYRRFITFCPVESIISSVEQAISMKDDIELKYRLVKVLFGS